MEIQRKVDLEKRHAQALKNRIEDAELAKKDEEEWRIAI